MNNSDLRRIKIRGRDIQGVNLREKIKEMSKGKIGFVRNRKDRNLVEIICKLDHAEEIKKNLDIWKERMKDFIKIDSIDIVENFFDKDDFKEGEFEIKREDDLQEMVWALRGAGKVFSDLEKQRVIGLIEGVKMEINRISDWLAGLSPNKSNDKFDPKSLSNFLMQHPIPFEAKETFDKLIGLEDFCSKTNNLISQNSKISKEEINIVLKNIDTIRESLDSLKEFL
ncbi:MAG: hypothetical protein HYX24_02820 [Candidatus Aenigmarchaeota archaeon]|nr:hypothetical protein [Candidatus Aenigmarchaeota archaeon]